MQDNFADKAFVDQAWAQMRQQLDQEMPQRRKRRVALVWWWLPVLIGIGLARRLPEKHPLATGTPLATRGAAHATQPATEPAILPAASAPVLQPGPDRTTRPRQFQPGGQPPAKGMPRAAETAGTATGSLLAPAPLVAISSLPQRLPALSWPELPPAELVTIPASLSGKWRLDAEMGGGYGLPRFGWWLGMHLVKVQGRGDWGLGLTYTNNQFTLAEPAAEAAFDLASQPTPLAQEAPALVLQTQQLGVTLQYHYRLGARIRLGGGVGLQAQLQSRLLPSSVKQLATVGLNGSSNRQLATEDLFGSGNSPNSNLPPERLRRWNGQWSIGGQYQLAPHWAATLAYEHGLGNLLRSSTYQVVPQQLRVGLQYRWSWPAARRD